MMEDLQYIKLKVYLKGLIEDLVATAQTKVNWIKREEAKRLLGISSNTTLQEYRDSDKVRFTQHNKTILYCRKSIEDFHMNNANY